MTGVLGILESREPLATDADAHRCLRAMRARGNVARLHRADGALLGATRFDWESELVAGDPERLTRDGDLVVVADATLYYHDDLRRAIRARGVEAAGTSAAALIAAAYRAWGVDCVHRLEGDFAFVLYDQSRRLMLCARDFTGRRTLYFAQLAHALVVASSIPGVLAYPGCPPDLDLRSIGSLAASMFAQESDTPYRAIKSLPAGARLICESGKSLHEDLYWRFPPFDERATGSFHDAALELRELLASAVHERLAPAGPTSLWMSGGYDSPAIYGAGKMRLRGLNQEDRLRAVSMGYPVGDPARENEFIAEIADFWGAPVHWIEIGDAPLMLYLAEFAARADEPFMHAFEAFFRALLGGARGVGSRVALMGDGGDNLFAVSTVFMRDLFASFRWTELGREWRAFGPQGYRAFFNKVVAPVAKSLARLGRPDPRSLMHQPPPWIREDFIREHQLIEREMAGELRLTPRGLSRASVETTRAVRYPLISKISGAYAAAALEAGLELRAPLLDQRIVNFAARRPRSERASRGEVKWLLRKSGEGLLPPGVLARRDEKTGVLTGYFERSLRTDSSGLVEESCRDSILAQLGVVDPVRLRVEWDQFRQKGGQLKGFKLFLTMQVELWLRGHVPSAGVAGMEAMRQGDAQGVRAPVR